MKILTIWARYFEGLITAVGGCRVESLIWGCVRSATVHTGWIGCVFILLYSFLKLSFDYLDDTAGKYKRDSNCLSNNILTSYYFLWLLSSPQYTRVRLSIFWHAQNVSNNVIVLRSHVWVNCYFLTYFTDSTLHYTALNR